MNYKRFVMGTMALMLCLGVGVAWAAGVSGTLVNVGAGDFIVGSDGLMEWAGVIVIDLNGQQVATFCTDLHHGIGLGDQVVATDQKMDCRVKWLMYHYPPALTGLSNLEAAARQVVVWHFSDNFTMNWDTPIGARAKEIIDEVNALTNNGANPSLACDDLWPAPLSLTLSPSNGVVRAGQMAQFTVTAKQGDAPVTGLTVDVSSNLGELSNAIVTTNQAGQATFTVLSPITGTATVAAHARYELPIGTVLQGLDSERQKLVLGESSLGDVFAEAAATWQGRGDVLVHLFHDRNLNGQQGEVEVESHLVSWQVNLQDSHGQIVTGFTDSYGNVNFSNLADGTYTASYVLLDGWRATTPTQSTVVINHDNQTVIFGAVQTPLIVAHQFNDLNGNGLKDEGEPMLADWEMALHRQNGDFVLGANGLTDSNGQVVLSFLRGSEFVAGRYYVTVNDLPHSGWVMTTPTQQSVDLVSGAYLELFFGSQNPSQGTLTIVKQANVSHNFGFMGDLGAFTLATGGSQTFTNLTPGSFMVSEDSATLSGDYWALLSVRCVDGLNQPTAVQPDLAHFKANITVGSGQHVTCTFLNETANLSPEDSYRVYLPLVVQ